MVNQASNLILEGSMKHSSLSLHFRYGYQNYNSQGCKINTKRWMKTTATEQETDSILLENSFEGHRDGESKPWAQGRTQFLYHHHYLTSQPPSSHEALPFVPAGHCLGTVVTLWRELQFDSTTAATFEMAIANYSPVKFYLISHATR